MSLSKRSIFTVAGAVVAATLAFQAPAQANDLTVYSAGPKSLIDDLAIGFEAATGIKVNVFQAGTGAMMARLEAERSNPQADVVISASWDTAVDYDARGDLLAYTSPNAAMVPDILKTETYVAQGASVLAIMWNSQSGKPRPTDWADLAAPEYKDAVTMPDPAQSGAAYGLLAGVANHPAMGWDLIERLAQNGMTAPGLNAAAMNPVMQGAAAAVFGVADYLAWGAQEKGETVDVIYPTSGTLMEARPMMILKSTRNPDAAKAFIDYVLSEQGQALVAREYLLTARTDIDGKRPGLDEIVLLDDDAIAGGNREETLARFRSVMGIQ